ncbi:CTLH/CRA C-terminal to lish motif domain-containing protein [Rhodofomes roseus]|uniref:CTLH/CRA C-terminal to lish motif domain-containing protein n=1 Tax=Rhodofomes roseus TaxID=34475 RepID=A0ABQ8KF33_9APHY|nr:CTLH/CRA C-terminal to lish motif domain-containing protein [Rhodofomes roseus]KAH9836322.1 CTLH/CRA C-terminal to lish motif domain-containing protein [Rhodofomes roseus]
MSANKLNTEGIMLFEQPFARVPYENYRKVFRTSQKNIEKELGAVQTAASDIAKRAKPESSDAEDAIKAVDGMITRVENLKRKLADLQSSSGAPTLGVMRERFQHLMSVETMQTTNDPEFPRWADTRLDRWLVDWSLRNGKEKTAKMIADDRGVERLVDIDLFSDIRRIEDALKQRSCAEALVWCSENKSALRKVKNTLEFDLRLQEYIELARAGKNIEAIAYSKRHLLPWQETHLPQIRQASALLCFPSTTTCSPYKRLYDLSRWHSLIQSFRLAFYNLSTLPSEPLLHLAMYAGLASLKLPACYDPQTKNVDCPVCDPSLGKLAEEVPFSHHVNSTIVCRLTGRIMDEDNKPMAFPNSGQVYSREALEDMATRNDGIVKDPQTGETCEFSALRRLFIS